MFVSIFASILFVYIFVCIFLLEKEINVQKKNIIIRDQIHQTYNMYIRVKNSQTRQKMKKKQR